MRIIVNCSCNLGDSSGASNKCIKGKWFEPQVTAATAGKTNLQVKDTGFSIKRSKHFNRLLVVIIYSYNMDATDLQWLHYFQYQFICRYFHSKLITDLVWNVRGGEMTIAISQRLRRPLPTACFVLPAVQNPNIFNLLWYKTEKVLTCVEARCCWWLIFCRINQLISFQCKQE